MTQLTDRFGRHFPYLRLSLLEACNFHCSYCLPNGYRARDGHSRWLQRDEICRLLRAFAAVGMSKLRLTGGEPSLRVDLTEIISDAAAIDGINTIALTTNGVLLQQRLADWQRAGLTAINISMDSLDAQNFHRITGHDRGVQVRQGVDLALELGMPVVKINAVLLRNLNNNELPQWQEFLQTRNVTLRFIELMQTGENGDYFKRHHLPAEQLESNLLEQGWMLQARHPEAGPARNYAHPDYQGRIGIIAPYSKDFCSTCNRLRVTATGDLRLCLFGEFGVALRPMLQTDAQQDELIATLHAQLGIKKASHQLQDGKTGLIPHLAAIGG